MAAIQSGWTRGLQLSGVLDAARWNSAGSMHISPGTILVQNDAQFLYIGLDVIKDSGNDPLTDDYFWLSFDFDKDKKITPNVDVQYGQFPGQPNHIAKSLYIRPFETTTILPSAGASECRIGFGASLKSPIPHRMIEVKVPLADIGGSLSATPAHVFMGVRVHSRKPAFTIDVPTGFDGDFSSLTEVKLMQDPAVLINGIFQADPQVATAIQWQATPGDPNNAYAPPTAANMVPYANWSARQKADLAGAFQVAYQWMLQGAPSVPPTVDGVTDAPANVHPNVNDDTVTALQGVTATYAWRLYVNHVAFSLVHMTSGLQTGGFSLAGLSAEELRWLLSSSTLAWNVMGHFYGMGTYDAYVPQLRANNLPASPFAPPRWVYSWLRDNQIIDQTRKDTIDNLLEWMRQHLVHFYGPQTYGNCDAVWQYRGYPPLSRIVTGTTDANNPTLGQADYTMGCHGSVGFLNAMLRVLNIPVLPVWVCGHELAYFPTEGLYLDHGDDPYNLNVRSSTQPISLVLIDEATYAARFDPDPTINISAGNGCNSVGLSAQNFPQ